MDSNVLVVSKKGKVLGGSKCDAVPYIRELIEQEVGRHIDGMLNERLLSILSTKENVNLQTLGFSEEAVAGYQAIITPIDIAGERLGTLFIYKKEQMYEIDDIILSEYGTTVVGLEMLRSVNEENAEETRKEHIVQSAISTLSYSELEAIIHIFEELDGTEGILVASKIADRVGITRSVIVNALILSPMWAWTDIGAVTPAFWVACGWNAVTFIPAEALVCYVLGTLLLKLLPKVSVLRPAMRQTVQAPTI